MAWIPGGTFRMGSEEFYPEERPIHEVSVDGFLMDSYEVTNEQFARFVEATSYPQSQPESLWPHVLKLLRLAGDTCGCTITILR